MKKYANRAQSGRPMKSTGKPKPNPKGMYAKKSTKKA